MKSIQSLLLQISTESGPGTRTSEHTWYTAIMGAFLTKGSSASTLSGAAHRWDLKGQKHSREPLGFVLLRRRDTSVSGLSCLRLAMGTTSLGVLK